MDIEHNEYGTPVARFTCKTCGTSYTICPVPPEEEKAGWENCGIKPCPSYDINRDVDLLFLPEKEFRELPVVGIDILRARRTGLFTTDGTHITPCPGEE